MEGMATRVATRYLRAGWLSWKDVSNLAIQNGGQVDRTYREVAPAAQDTQWAFEAEAGYGNFVQAIRSKHMTFKANPKNLSVIVWF